MAEAYALNLTLPRRRRSLRERLTGTLRGSLSSRRRRSSGDSPTGLNWIHEDQVLRFQSVKYKVKYLGCQNTQVPKGTEVILQAIRALKTSSRHVDVWLSLYVSQETLKLVDENDPENKTLVFEFATYRVSSVSEYKKDDVYLGMIIRHGRLAHHKVHVFETEHESAQVALTLAQAFQLAFTRYMKMQEEEPLARLTMQTSEPALARPDQTAAEVRGDQLGSPVSLGAAPVAEEVIEEGSQLSFAWLTEEVQAFSPSPMGSAVAHANLLSDMEAINVDGPLPSSSQADNSAGNPQPIEKIDLAVSDATEEQPPLFTQEINQAAEWQSLAEVGTSKSLFNDIQRLSLDPENAGASEMPSLQAAEPSTVDGHDVICTRTIGEDILVGIGSSPRPSTLPLISRHDVSLLVSSDSSVELELTPPVDQDLVCTNNLDEVSHVDKPEVEVDHVENATPPEASSITVNDGDQEERHTDEQYTVQAALTPDTGISESRDQSSDEDNSNLSGARRIYAAAGPGEGGDIVITAPTLTDGHENKDHVDTQTEY